MPKGKHLSDEDKQLIKKDATELLADQDNYRTFEELAAQLKVSPSTLYSLRREDPEFNKVCEETIHNQDNYIVQLARKGLEDNVKEGKETSIIFALKTKGGYTEQSQEDTVTQKILSNAVQEYLKNNGVELI